MSQLRGLVDLHDTIKLHCSVCYFSFNFPALSYLQVLVGESAVPAIHRLEQVSTEEKVGSLAENLLEALRDHPDVEKKVS